MAPVEADAAGDGLQSAADFILEPPRGDGLAAAYGARAADGQRERRGRETAALFSVAESLLRRGEAEEALQLALEALEAARGGDPAAEADLLRLVIHCLRYKEKHNFAMQMAEEELGIFEKRGDELGQAKIFLSLAEVSVDRRGQDHRKKALQWAEEARRIFREAGQQKLEAMTLLVLVKVYLTSKDGHSKELVRRSQKAALEAIGIFSAIKDRHGEARARHCQGAAFAFDRNTEAALRESDSARKLFRSLGDGVMEAFELQSAATWRLVCNDPWGALPDAEEALAMCRALNCSAALEASALGCLARAHCARGDAPAALHLLRGGLQRLRLAGEPAAEGRALDALSRAYAAANDIKGARRAAERARAAFRSMGNKQMESLMLRTCSRLYIMDWESGHALETAEEALTLGFELQNRKDKADALLQLARARLASGLFLDAAQAAQEAQSAFAEQMDRVGEGVSLLTMGLVCSDQGQHDPAAKHMMQAYLLFREAGDDANEARALSHICEVQIARGAWEKAISAAEKARALYDELGDRSGQVTVLLHVAQASLRQYVEEESNEDWDILEECKLAALASAGEAVSICREDEEQHRDLLARALFMLAQAELMDQRPQEVLEDAQEALELFIQAGDMSSQAAALDAVARAHCLFGNDEEAKQAASEALALFVSLGDEQGEAQMFTLLDQLGFRKSQEEAEQPRDTVQLERGEQPKPIVPRNIAIRELDTSGGISLQLVQDRLREHIADLTGSDDIEMDEGLLATGLTSSTAVMLSTALSADFPQVAMPSTVAFDYPTVNSVAAFLYEKSK